MAKAKQKTDNNVVPLQPFASLGNRKKQGFAGPHKAVEEITENFTLPADADQRYRASIARLTGGISPASLYLAYADWLLHLSSEPRKMQLLAQDAFEKHARLANYSARQMMGQDCPACIETEEKDDRFEGKEWQSWPFNMYAQSFLLAQDWWQKATSGVHGINRHHEDVVRFATRQIMDMCSPGNFPLTNPKIMEKTLEERGLNLIRGAQNFNEDIKRFLNNELPRGTEDFQVGHDLATAEGKVVFRNEVMELIQYAPQTDKVYPEPVLITPAWIMKYYILDLSPHNSLVRFLVDKGHTVFMISWKNPDESDANLGMEDYRKKGFMDALDAVSAIVPDQKIHAVGYCLGGTLASIAAADMARHKDDRLKTLTLFTTQLDYEEAGELLLFIDQSELAFLDDLMKEQGYLDKFQLSGAFNMLRSKDLIWSHVVEQYMKGEEAEMFDLMAWNVDSTRLPPRMHSEYLRRFYLNNDLAENRYQVHDHIISMQDINMPVFAVSTRKDHIAPWKSVYKLHNLLDTELTFVLTNGGHNAGVVSEPGHKGRKYQIENRKPGDSYQTAEEWQAGAREKKGSWWTEWQKWLKNQSGNKVNPPPMGAKNYKPLDDAPGTYVYQK